MNGRARETVQKLWNASKSLQGGGVTYYEYVTELTYLLLLKMLAEVSRADKKLEARMPTACRWAALRDCADDKRLPFYRQLLATLGDASKVKFPLVNQVYTDAKTSLTKANSLASLITAIDKIDWHAAEEDGLGDLYEGLLEKTATERKSKAGQYFTPRPLIEAIITLMRPRVGEVIQDPAAGTGGFLIAAHRAIIATTNDLKTVGAKTAHSQRNGKYQGAELITGTHRLNTMNLLLHGIDTPIACIDALSDAAPFDPADLILTNPPFNKFPERVTRSDLTITEGAAKGPLPFVEHVVRGLRVGGRAAIIIPDNVLFEDNLARELRTWLMDLCDLHTILRLPTGIFYAQGVKTNVLFLTKKAEKRVGATRRVWFYDLRTKMPSFGKTRALTNDDFLPFIRAFGDDPLGGSKRTEEGTDGRFRVFSRAELAARNDNLDVSWMRGADELAAEVQLTEPEDLAAAILGHLRAALADIDALADELAEEEEQDEKAFR